jgi:hypothetical protein
MAPPETLFLPFPYEFHRRIFSERSQYQLGMERKLQQSSGSPNLAVGSADAATMEMSALDIAYLSPNHHRCFHLDGLRGSAHISLDDSVFNTERLLRDGHAREVIDHFRFAIVISLPPTALSNWRRQHTANIRHSHVPYVWKPSGMGIRGIAKYMLFLAPVLSSFPFDHLRWLLRALLWRMRALSE